MKFLLIIICIPLLGRSQDTTISFVNVVYVEGQTKDQLFQHARQWYNSTFRSSKDVLQIIDKETGELSGKGYISSYWSTKLTSDKGRILCTLGTSIGIYVKDGRYKYEFTNFYEVDEKTGDPTEVGILTSSNKSPFKWALMSQAKSDVIYQSYRYHLDARMIEILLSLEKAMKQGQDRLNF